MFNGLFGIGRAYKKLPPHHNFAELTDNHLMDRSLGGIATEGYLKAPNCWEWKLGRDLVMLGEYARDFVPQDCDGLHPR